MAGFVAKTAANHLLKKQMKQYEDKNVADGYDPYFAMIEDPRRPGKMKKVKKQIPEYIPEHDALILASVRKTAYRLDMCLFNFAGIRFGWEAVIGIIPGFGDAVGLLMALMVYRKCKKIDGGLDASLQFRMMINILADFIIGLIPIIGDLGDAAFKCNTKNARLLEVHLDKKYKPSAQGRDGRDAVGVNQEQRRKKRQSGIYAPQDPPPATVFEDFSDEEDERRDFIRQSEAQGSAAGVSGAAGARTTTTTASANANANASNTRPAAATQPDKKRGSWFSGSRSNRPAAGTEMVQPPRA